MHSMFTEKCKSTFFENITIACLYSFVKLDEYNCQTDFVFHNWLFYAPRRFVYVCMIFYCRLVFYVGRAFFFLLSKTFNCYFFRRISCVHMVSCQTIVRFHRRKTCCRSCVGFGIRSISVFYLFNEILFLSFCLVWELLVLRGVKSLVAK